MFCRGHQFGTGAGYEKTKRCFSNCLVVFSLGWIQAQDITFTAARRAVNRLGDPFIPTAVATVVVSGNTVTVNGASPAVGC